VKVFASLAPITLLSLTVVACSPPGEGSDHTPGAGGGTGASARGAGGSGSASGAGGSFAGGASGVGGIGAPAGGSGASGGAAAGGDAGTGGSGTGVPATCSSEAGPQVPELSGLRIDFDFAGRALAEVQEPGYESWAVAEQTSDERTFDGVTFTLEKSGSAGTTLEPVWHKASVQSPNFARLIGDGVSVAEGAGGGAIELTISGLSAGTHSLATYHNAPNDDDWAPMNISVDGADLVTGLTPSTLAIKPGDAAVSYVEFEVAAGDSVSILFSPTSSGSVRNVILNALALDVADPNAQAKLGAPDNRDWHVDADDGTATLSWTAGEGAASHRLYFGTDMSAVVGADAPSSLLLTEQATTSYDLSGLSHLQYYYWRVDEVASDGGVTPGDVWAFSPRHLAFPGAEGHGRLARGGRCGKVVHVTNLNDSGPGSLREAFSTDTGPRTIVFDVSGVIELESRMTMAGNFVTVAGQTAPGKGIVIRAAPVGVAGVNDAIMRFMKVRLGYGVTYDGMGLTGSNHSIFDHNSISWTIDEAFSSRDAKNITLQKTLIAEALNVADHANYPAGTAHGYAGTISGNTGSFHHNLLAHNAGRNFSMGAAIDGAGVFVSRLDLFNNVVYNFGSRATDGQVHLANFVANYYKKGPATTLNQTFSMDLENYGTGTLQAYYSGNILENTDGSFECDGTDDSCGRRYTLSNGNPEPTWEIFPTDGPLFESHATIHSARDAYKIVLSDVGVTMPVFDEHDQRMIQETLAGTAQYEGSVSGLPGLIDREGDASGFEDYPEETRDDSFDADGDGLPGWWEDFIGTSDVSGAGDFSDSNADDDGDGSTNLEEYLEWMATPHLEIAPSQTGAVDISALFRGFTAGPTFAAVSDACANPTVNGDELTVAPTSACGLTYVAVTVTDSEGSTMTRSVGVFVTGSVQ